MLHATPNLNDINTDGYMMTSSKIDGAFELSDETKDFSYLYEDITTQDFDESNEENSLTVSDLGRLKLKHQSVLGALDKFVTDTSDTSADRIKELLKVCRSSIALVEKKTREELTSYYEKKMDHDDCNAEIKRLRDELEVIKRESKRIVEKNLSMQKNLKELKRETDLKTMEVETMLQHHGAIKHEISYLKKKLLQKNASKKAPVKESTSSAGKSSGEESSNPGTPRSKRVSSARSRLSDVIGNEDLCNKVTHYKSLYLRERESKKLTMAESNQKIETSLKLKECLRNNLKDWIAINPGLVLPTYKDIAYNYNDTNLYDEKEAEKVYMEQKKEENKYKDLRRIFFNSIAESDDIFVALQQVMKTDAYNTGITQLDRSIWERPKSASVVKPKPTQDGSLLDFLVDPNALLKPTRRAKSASTISIANRQAAANISRSKLNAEVQKLENKFFPGDPGQIKVQSKSGPRLPRSEKKRGKESEELTLAEKYSFNRKPPNKAKIVAEKYWAEIGTNESDQMSETEHKESPPVAIQNPENFTLEDIEKEFGSEKDYVTNQLEVEVSDSEQSDHDDDPATDFDDSDNDVGQCSRPSRPREVKRIMDDGQISGFDDSDEDDEATIIHSGHRVDASNRSASAQEKVNHSSTERRRPWSSITQPRGTALRRRPESSGNMSSSNMRPRSAHHPSVRFADSISNENTKETVVDAINDAEHNEQLIDMPSEAVSDKTTNNSQDTTAETIADSRPKSANDVDTSQDISAKLEIMNPTNTPSKPSYGSFIGHGRGYDSVFRRNRTLTTKKQAHTSRPTSARTASGSRDIYETVPRAINRPRSAIVSHAPRILPSRPSSSKSTSTRKRTSGNTFNPPTHKVLSSLTISGASFPMSKYSK